MELVVQTVSPAPVPAEASQHMVRMRDGARLATDLYLPQEQEQEPRETVLVRLCYDKDGRYPFMPRLAPLVTSRGYALVVQDVRGKFRSEGTTLAFVHESRDGYDTIEWIVTQPWSNGRVGMFGDSYYGFTQWAAVSSGHPALRAIVPRVTSTGLATVAAGGTPKTSGPVEDVPWLVMADYLAHYWLDELIHEYPVDLGVRPLIGGFEGAFRALGKRSASYDMLVPRGLPVPVYPDGHPFDARPIPVLHAVGWFDNLQIPHMRDYCELARRPGWSQLQYLVADSVDHEGYQLSLTPISESSDHNVNDEALARMLPTYIGPALDFFDVFLKELRPATSLPRVRWHLAHEGYHESPTWPPPEAQERRFYLTRLSEARAGRGELSEGPCPGPDRASWRHDPGDLVPSAVADSFAFLRSYPDEAATGDRPDVLVFTSEPAEAPVDLTGPVDLFLRLASSAPTTDVYAKLLDLGADGAARMIVRGQGHLTAPSATDVVRIEMGHTGYRLRPGHRLRLQIASSDFPEYLPHPGTTENPWLATAREVAEQTLHSDAVSPAYLSVAVSGAQPAAGPAAR